MTKQFIVGLDGSALAEAALPIAGVFAQAQGGKVVLGRVVASDEPGDDDAAEHYLAAVAGSLREGGSEVEAVLSHGEAASALIAEASARRADLIVLATHGRSGLGRWIYGSVADQVMRAADVPVVLVPPACPSNWPRGQTLRVLVPLDGSILAMEALRPAEQIARDLKGSLVLLHVVVPLAAGYGYGLGDVSPYVFTESDAEAASARRQMEDIAHQLRERGLAVTTRVVEGPAPATIADVARDEGAGLIVLASRGSGGIARAVLGSVATGVVQRAMTPVLIVGPRVAFGATDAGKTAPVDGSAESAANSDSPNGVSSPAPTRGPGARRREIETLESEGSPAAVERLLELLRTDRERSSPAIVRALVHLGPAAVPALLAAMHDPDDRVRWHVAEALARIRDPRAIAMFVGALEDPDRAVRWNAGRGLARLGRPAVVALLHALATRPLSPWLAQGAEHVLRQGIVMRPTPRLQALIAALSHSTASVEVPVRAADALDELEAELPRESGT